MDWRRIQHDPYVQLGVAEEMWIKGAQSDQVRCEVTRRGVLTYMIFEESVYSKCVYKTVSMEYLVSSDSMSSVGGTSQSHLDGCCGESGNMTSL